MNINQSKTIPPLDGVIVTGIKLVDELTRSETFRSASLPGHLIHIIAEGEVEQEAGGIVERFKAGDSVWYWENEPVCGRIIKSPWRFYTVNFLAPSLPPPPLNERVKPVSLETMSKMQELLHTWRNTRVPQMARHIHLHTLLLDIIFDLLSETTKNQSAETDARLWWQLEATLRADLSQPINLFLLCELMHCSERSIFRACKKATGLSPMKRIKQIRLSYARGLVQFSKRSISEIAYELGYERVQEFSRDYKKHFSCTPTADRRHVV